MIGVVILNYIGWCDTIKCISSILDNDTTDRLHIYVIDNASPNSPPELFKSIASNTNVTFIKNIVNKGYSAGNNIGIKRALDDGCDAILIANSDIVFHKNCISLMYEYINKNASVGIVGPTILSSDGIIQNSNMFFKTGMKEKYLITTKLSVFFKNFMPLYYGTTVDRSSPFNVYAVSGCCLMLSKECAHKVTPFDENTFLYEEELILGIVMEKSGYKTVYLPQCFVTHLHGQSSKHIKAFSFICFVQSELYYCKRYLNATFYSTTPLYLIRTFSYLLRSLKSYDFITNLPKYLSITIRQLLALFWIIL